jgi:membrane protein YdbS with pleckstrin-like domain
MPWAVRLNRRCSFSSNVDDPLDDTARDAPESASSEPSTDSVNDPSAGAEGETRQSVAATAGIDEDVLDVSRELASTVRLQWGLRAAVRAVMFAVLTAGFFLVVSVATPFLSGTIRTAARIGGTVAALLGFLGIVHALLLYQTWTYVIRSDSLYLSRGVFTRVRTVVPYVRVQHIDTTRSPLERLLGLSTLVVYTAGSRGADVRIPGLTPDRATTLQERLERLAIESDEADAV